MTKTGHAMFLFGAGTAAALGLAANEAVKWETAWTGVQKTVNGTQPELDQLEQQLRQLATTLPTTHEEIAAVAEAAGQLGVATPNIASFTKTMIDLGQTTNLTAEEAATAIAQLMNVMQSAPESVDRIGATLVALGNAGASTESDILSLAQRLSGVGKLTGATEAEVLALASSMANLGIQAELGGGAMSRVLTKIYADVHKGGDALDQWAKLAGVSADTFAKKFQTSPVQALNLVLAGMGRLKDGGGDLIGTLASLGLAGTQNMQVLLRLAGAGDSLTESLKTGNQAWKDNTALLNEANQRYATTASQVAIARNNLRDAGITMGETLLPAIAAVAGAISGMVRTWQDLPGPLHDAVTILAIAAAAIGIFGGAALIAIPKIAAFKTAVQGLEAGALKTAGTRLLGIGSILTGPWGLAIAGGITALGYFAAAHGKAMEKIDEFKTTLNETTGELTNASYSKALEGLQDSGWIDFAQKAGISAQELINGLKGVDGAMDVLSQKSQEWAGSGANPLNMWDIEKAHNFVGSVNEARNQMLFASDAQKQLIETNGVLGDATGAAGDAQKGTTEAWKDGADAAGQLTEEAKTLGEQMKELSQSYLDQRDAERGVRSSLRDIRDALKEYRKEHGGLVGAFREGSKSGDDFASMLDDLAKAYQSDLEATEKNGASQRELRRTYRESFDELVNMAEQLGMTKDQAKAYAETVLGLPADYTFQIHSNADEARQRVNDLQTAISTLHGADLAIRVREIHVQEQLSRHPEANGGIVTAYASGGIDGRGGYVPRVSQIAQGGRTIMWAEPETGWEAYISGKPGQESRNRAIWMEAGRRLGTVPAALEAASYAGRGGYGGGHTTVVQQLPDRFELVLDNGDSFTGYVRSHAADVATAVSRREIDADGSYRSGLEGMRC
jgi:TP901 family phage tail tape measure protein